MRFTASLFGLAAWSLFAVSHATAEGGEGVAVCGSEPSEAFLAASNELRVQEVDNAFEISRVQAEGFEVEVYFHIVTTTKEEMNKISDSALITQIDILNEAYKPHNIKFRQMGPPSRDVSPAGKAYSYPSLGVTHALRKGEYKSLNVYIMTSLGEINGGPLLGYAQFPEKVEGTTSSTFIKDGVAIVSGVLPQGSFPGHGGGKILIHEVGHWLGLLHTFQGGCSAQGDFVDDTPAQKDNSPGDCNTKRDSCPNDPGNDPVHNHMDYSSEPCRTEFTNGQVTRMFSMWNNFRDPKKPE